MNDNQAEKPANIIKNTQNNIAVVLGTVLALIMCGYFFTYALLTDMGRYDLLWAEALSSLVMLLILFNLKKVSFLLARLWLGRRPDLRDALAEAREKQKSENKS